MVRSNFGAVRLPLLGAAVLASFAVPLSAQVVEKGRTYADLVATHPCNSGNSGRLARVTDAQSSSSIGGGGGSVQVWAVCDGVDTWTLTSIGSAGGGAATAVTGSATLPATCTEKDLYQDTDSGGTEFYVCTATNTWTKTGSGTIGGSTGATDNAILAADGTGGATMQTRAITISDVSGVTTTLATITPAATTGATVAGQSLAVTASPAVASTDTAGANDGGSITLTAGAAARNTSGNAKGGDIVLTPGTGIGTGTAGQVIVPPGVVAAPSIAVSGQPGTGIYFDTGGSGSVKFATSGGYRMMVDVNGLYVNNLIGTGNGNQFGYLRRLVTSTAGSGAPNVISASQTQSTTTNEGTTAVNYNTLPTAASGLEYTFCVQDADGQRVTANTSDTIRVIDKVTAAAGYIESTTIGSCVELVAINAVEWFATSITGTWTDGTWSYDDTSLTTP